MTVRYAPRQLLRWRAALSQTAVGLKRSKIAFIGDSITMGSGGGSDPEGATRRDGCVGAYPWSPPSQLGRMLQSVAPTHDDAFFGDKGCPLEGVAGLALYDTRLAFEGEGWQRWGHGTGGRQFLSQKEGDSFRFTPTTPADTCEVYFGVARHHGNIRVSDSSGTLADLDCTYADVELGRTVVTRATASTDPFVLTHSTPGDTVFIGIDAYDSASPKVQIVNMGVFGQSAIGTVWGDHPWNFTNFLPMLAPDLCVVQLGSNDQSAEISIPDFMGAIQKIIDLAKRSGDVILSWRHPADPNERAPDMTQVFRQAHRDLALANDIPLVDLFDTYVSYEASKPLYFDFTHQTAAGSRVIASAWRQVVEQ